MPIDASIYGQVMTPGEIQQQIYRNQLLQFQTQQAMHQEQTQNALTQLFKSGFNPTTANPQQMQQLWGIDPRTAMAFQQQQQQRQLQQTEVYRNIAEGRHADASLATARLNEFNTALTPIKQAALLKYQDMLQRTGDQKMATEQAQQAYLTGLSQLPTGAYSPNLVQQARNWQFNPDLVRSQIYGKEVNADQERGTPPTIRNVMVGPDQEQQQQWDPASRSWKSIGPTVPRFKPRTIVNVSAGSIGNLPPKGWQFMRSDDGKTTYRVNPNYGSIQKLTPRGWVDDTTTNIGNLKRVGSSSGGFGSAMNQRFVNRVAGAANEGAAALISLSGMKNPDSGIFSAAAMSGAGGKNPAIGMLTPEAIKRYNATIAGLAPEIATAQNQGMVPHDGQINAVEQAITIGPTDDLRTKQYRIALAARYLRKALEVSNDLANPQQQKTVAKLQKELNVFPDPDEVLQGKWSQGVFAGQYPGPGAAPAEPATITEPAGQAAPMASKGMVNKVLLQQYAVTHKLSLSAARNFLKEQGYAVP